jgi:hypothetical protein
VGHTYYEVFGRAARATATAAASPDASFSSFAEKMAAWRATHAAITQQVDRSHAPCLNITTLVSHARVWGVLMLQSDYSTQLVLAGRDPSRRAIEICPQGSHLVLKIGASLGLKCRVNTHKHDSCSNTTAFLLTSTSWPARDSSVGCTPSRVTQHTPSEREMSSTLRREVNVVFRRYSLALKGVCVRMCVVAGAVRGVWFVVYEFHTHTHLYSHTHAHIL